MIEGHAIIEQDTSIRPFPQESLLIDAVAEMSGQRLLCTSAGLGQFAVAAARALPNASVCCTYLDLYRANLAIKHWPALPSNLRIKCAADLPDEVVDVVALPFSAGGEADLTRDLIQTGHQRLREGGRLFATSENRKDTWLGEQLRNVFRKLEQRKMSRGVLYVGTKTEPLKKVKNYACEFAFRDRGRLIRAFSRPGVFSHRHIDAGSRQLIDEMQIDAKMRVLDIGCGAGVVALAAACRVHDVQVHALDSNTRAIHCTQRGAELNELINLTTELNAAGNYADAGRYDLALANPPYYSGFRIARHFLTAGRDALRPGGKILVVTKRPDWYQEHMSQWFDGLLVTQRKGYHLVHGVRPAD
jgi:16S rRNA (guanine1207-N2)-methyltransferase